MKKVILAFSIVLFHCKDKDSINILMTTEIGTITIELLPKPCSNNREKFFTIYR